MNWLKDFFKNHGITTHTVAAAYVSLFAFYESNKEVQTYIKTTALSIYHSMPHWLSALTVGLVIPLVTWYWNKLSIQGKLAAGQQAVNETATPIKPEVKG